MAPVLADGRLFYWSYPSFSSYPPAMNAPTSQKQSLTQDQIDFFMANGYLSIGKVLDDDTIALLRREYDGEFARAQTSGNYRNLATAEGATTEQKCADSKDPLYDISKQIDTSKATVLPLPAGGAMLHHCQTLHYTQPNTTDRQRRAFIIHYMTPGTRGKGEPLPVSFERPMLRMCL